jgi:hypothetical protein
LALVWGQEEVVVEAVPVQVQVRGGNGPVYMQQSQLKSWSCALIVYTYLVQLCGGGWIHAPQTTLVAGAGAAAGEGPYLTPAQVSLPAQCKH